MADVIWTITGQLYYMDSLPATSKKTFLSQVNSTACKRLNLQRREKIIFFRFLYFLLRSDKPFSLSVASICETTGYDRRSVFRGLNELERLRLITRTGYTKTLKYSKGSVLIRICSLVTNRNKIALNKNLSLVTPCHQTRPTSDTMSYLSNIKKVSKEKGYNLKYHIYLSKFKSGVELGLTPKNQKPMTLEEFELSAVE